MFTAPEKMLLRNTIRSTWEQIGPDVMQCSYEMGEDTDAECAIESCIDADRLKVFSNKENAAVCYEILRREYKLSDYPTVLYELAKFADPR